jgi:hypothetical protein
MAGKLQKIGLEMTPFESQAKPNVTSTNSNREPETSASTACKSGEQKAKASPAEALRQQQPSRSCGFRSGTSLKLGDCTGNTKQQLACFLQISKQEHVFVSKDGVSERES